MLADALPDVKRRIPLLRDIGKRNTELIQRVVAWIHDVMRRFHDHFYTPKGGLTSLQRRAMVRAFGNLVLSIRDVEGKPIFRVGHEGARIILHDKSPLPDVKYSPDKREGAGDTEETNALMQLYRKGAYNELVRMDEERRDIPYGSTQKQAKVVQADLLNRYRNLDITNKSTGEVARIMKDGAGKMVSDKAIAKSITNGFFAEEHLQAVSEIKTLFEDGNLIRVRHDNKGSADIQAIKSFWNRREDGSYAEQYTDERIPQKIYTLELQELKRPSDLKDVSDEHPSEGTEPHTTALGFGAPRGKGSLSNSSIAQKEGEENRNPHKPEDDIRFSANIGESRKGNFKYLVGAIRSFVGGVYNSLDGRREGESLYRSGAAVNGGE